MNQRIRGVLACAATLVIVGCGDDDETAPRATTPDEVTAAASTATSAAVTATIGGAIDTTVSASPAAPTTSISTTTATSTTDGRVVSSPSENVRQGDTGPGVEQIQQALASAGYDLGVDGIFGRVTDRAVRDFQEANGLTVDGVVGPKTWAKLSEAPAPTSTTP